MRYRQEYSEGDGWTRWVTPEKSLYKMACCDCGLVHRLQFRSIKTSRENARGEFTIERVRKGKTERIQFRAARAKRETSAHRRNRKFKEKRA